MRRATLVWFSALVTALPTAAFAQSLPCDQLSALSLPQARVTAAHVVAAGAFVLPPRPAGAPPIAADAFQDLPPFCRVAATLTPSADSDIKIEVWLPLTAWNGKFQGVGNGGLAGTITYSAGRGGIERGMAEALRRGYATASTDTGHSADQIPLFLGNSDKLVDFGYRAVHEITGGPLDRPADRWAARRNRGRLSFPSRDGCREPSDSGRARPRGPPRRPAGVRRRPDPRGARRARGARAARRRAPRGDGPARARRRLERARHGLPVAFPDPGDADPGTALAGRGRARRPVPGRRHPGRPPPPVDPGHGPGPGRAPRSSVEAGLRNVAYALLSGADGWMFDGEDALGQVDTMSLDNQRNLRLAFAMDPRFLAVAEGVADEMNRWAEGFLGRRIVDDWRRQLGFTTRIYRARGLHLDDRHVRAARTARGSRPRSWTSSLYVVANAATLRAEGRSVVLYLPEDPGRGRGRRLGAAPGRPRGAPRAAGRDDPGLRPGRAARGGVPAARDPRGARPPLRRASTPGAGTTSTRCRTRSTATRRSRTRTSTPSR